MKVRVVLTEPEPLVPVIVIGYVPGVASADTVRVRFDLPEPVTEVGLKLAVTPAGRPVADSVTVERNTMELPDTETTTIPLCPGSTEVDVGETETEKPAGPDAVTVSETVAVCVIPPPVPVMVSVEVPVAAVDATVSVNLDEPEPGAGMDAGLKLAVTPEGKPVTDKATAELNPPDTVVVMVDEPLLP